MENHLMNDSIRMPVVIGFVVVLALFLIFSGGAMTGPMMSGSGMGHGWIGGFSWMWIPALISLGLSVPLGWSIFGKK